MKTIISSFLLLFIGPSLFAQGIPEQVKSVLDSMYKTNPKSSGLMIHIEAPNNGISWSYAVGYADTLSKTPIEKDQPAAIASNTKTYTSASILRLIEEKKLSLHQPIGELLSNKTKIVLQKDTYNLKRITIYHLLTHTSGIADYIDDSYIQILLKNPKYRWTRDAQIARSVEVGNKLGEPGDLFSYADVNFILLTEIIEQQTDRPFYESMRKLLKYEQLGLNDTWFHTLEKKPENTKPYVIQYYSKMGVNSHDTDPSFDLYGAGGIWTTTSDLARFAYALFDEQIIEDEEVFDLIYTPAKTKDNADHSYHLGLSSTSFHGLKAYGHGGFWGTVVHYIPDLDVSVAVYVLEKDQRFLRKDIVERVVEIFQKEFD